MAWLSSSGVAWISAARGEILFNALFSLYICLGQRFFQGSGEVIVLSPFLRCYLKDPFAQCISPSFCASTEVSPIIRYVCQKSGKDHGTVVQHAQTFVFPQLLAGSLFAGENSQNNIESASNRFKATGATELFTLKHHIGDGISHFTGKFEREAKLPPRLG